jgi:FkbM family methyltransferase
VTCARFRGRTLEFEGDPHDGDLISVFLLQDYAPLPVEGRQVLDVGASIGDSAAYFAARGAAKVVAVEPWPRTYLHLARNVVRNGFGATIVAVHSGVGHPGEVRIDAEQSGSAAHQVLSANAGATVPIRTLEQLTDEFGITDGILKMDCEGSEYAAILEASPAVLRRFSHLMMEYHYGYRNLKRQLEAAGFSVQVERPATRFEPAFTPSQVGVGNLYAERR